MRRYSFRFAFAIFAAISLAVGNSRSLHAQSEVGVYGGLWIPILPDYRAASLVTPGGGTVLVPNLFQDEQEDAGGQIGIRGLHRFVPTRTMLEFDLNIAGVEEMGSRASFTDGGAGETIWLANLAGTNAFATADGQSVALNLDSDVLHHSQYIGLRDRFDLCKYGMGVVDLGCGFSHMAFIQNHTLGAVLSNGFTGEYDEDVDNEYYGIDIRSSFHRRLGRRNARFDLNFGIYDFDGDYDGVSRFRDAAGTLLDSSRVVDSISETAFTVDLGIRLESSFGRMLLRPGVSFKYISDMVSINHPQTTTASEPVSLTTGDAYLIGLNVELLL